ncbi:hypothetical protein [Methylobacterium oryzihabitans]|uniref:Uncharacterized protein n=1 Tax=Methylobacterium oryzihabitans TaxID=2499852 RepID=A0A437PHR6_9HYPH|nr:hypothetical protein [Methylobacterium oryzihabitans]RVU21812.1 hypothetical protein EOE48_01835 [Methylobacterium oryzihabitans]
MKALLIVLWTLAAGIVLFLIVRNRITRMTQDLAARGTSETGGPPDESGPPKTPPDPPPPP